MKNHFCALFVAVLFGVLFTSCTKDDEYDDVVGIEVRLRNASNGGGEIELFEIDSAYHYYGNDYSDWYSTGVYLAISSSNNFYAFFSPEYFCSNTAEFSIACIGSVRNLGKIRNIPSSGWSNQVAVNPGSGYIIRGKNNNPNSKWHYARVYVENWINGASNGGIIGAVVSYQPDWKVE